MPIEDDKPNFQEIKARLKLNEDRDLAQKLQEEEYARHYERNRSIGNDGQKSREEQLREDEEARRARREMNKPIEESDEELARRLQEEFDNEERQLYEDKEMQLQRDAELAAALAARYEALPDFSLTSSNDTNQATSSSSQCPASFQSGDLIDFSEQRQNRQQQ